MQTLTKAIIDAGWSNKVVTETQLARLLDGTPQRRHNLVNRALYQNEVISLSRGRYLLKPALLNHASIHPFVLAQTLRPGSYISFESALTFHGWIPEATQATLAVVPSRRKHEMTHPLFGRFQFFPLALQPGFFLEGVDRHLLNHQAALIAQPLRALLDWLCLRKQNHAERDFLERSLRIEPELFNAIKKADLKKLLPVYQHQRMQNLIHTMYTLRG